MNKNWLRKEVRSFEPYDVPDLQEKIIINANESPYNVFDFPEIKKEFMARFEQMPSYRYPDPMARELRSALGDYIGCKAEEVLVGNGGDEIISIIINTFLDAEDTLLVHSPTFDIYNIDAQIIGGKTVCVNDLPGYKRDMEGILAKVKELQPKLTIICNPNNPTGEILPLSFVEEVVKSANNVVVVDEAYLEFAGAESITSKLEQYYNLIVIRTLSKAFGMAGLRVGYAVAQKDLIDAMSTVKAVYNVNSISQIAALSVMKYSDMVLKHNVPPTIEARQYLYDALNSLDGVTCYESATNFLLVKVPDGEAYYNALKEAGISVRVYKSEALKNCMRISVTTMDVVKQVEKVFEKESRNA